jgi:iron complex outermembrane receptor protein
MKNKHARKSSFINYIGVATTLLIPYTVHAVDEETEKTSGINEKSIEKIVITSQKKSLTLQKTPAAITAVSSDTFAVRGISDISGIQNLVPSVRLQKESVSTQIYMRGVGSTLDFPMIEPPNAYNINGIYIPREVSSATLVDVERVEVLPGPQGTLYGRGAMGGVINMLTKRPTDEFETNIIAEVGNDSLVRTSITQNVPINEDLSFRGTLSYLNNDGHQKTGADAADDIASFLSMNYNINDNVNLFLWGHYEKKEGKSSNLVSKGENGNPKSQRFPNGDPWDDTLTGDLASFATLGPIDARDKEWETLVVGAELNVEISDSVSLTYIPSIIDFEWQQEYWITHKLSNFNEKIAQQTHELRLDFDNGGSWTGLAGLYLYKIETEGQLFIQFGSNELGPNTPAGWTLDASDIRDHELQGAALFGEAQYHISDDLRLLFGSRISYDKREANGFQPEIVEAVSIDDDPVGLFSGVGTASWENSKSWNNIDWKVGIEHDTAEGGLHYATIQTGFQPGTFDVFPESVTSESKLVALTVGSKYSFLDGQIQFNDELFYYKYDALLTQAFDASNGTNRLLNADTTIYGVQLDSAFYPNAMPYTQFKFSVGYLHARYDDFLGDGITDELEAFLDTFNGLQLQNAPDWTSTIGIIHDWELESGAYVRMDISSRYESSYWGDFSHSSGLYQEAYFKTDITLTYHSDNDWSIALWGKNLENQAVQSAAAPGNPVSDPGPGATFLEAPISYGLRFSMSL